MYIVFPQDFNCHKIAKMKILTGTHPNISNHSVSGLLLALTFCHTISSVTQQLPPVTHDVRHTA